MTTDTLPRIDFAETTLANGLRVVLAPDRTAPIVAVNLWYGIGSRGDSPGLSGLAHLFEHMMFQGSRNVAKGEHFELIQAAGGTLNASTWWHRTNYFDTAPSHHVELLLWLEADRMGTLAITQENLDNQRDVVKNERRERYDDQPYGTWILDLQGRVFPDGHPFNHTTIGSMDDLSAASVEDCVAFFALHYAPNNAVLTIAGDIEPDAALALAERHLGQIPANPAVLAPPDASVTPGSLGIREVLPDRNAPLPRIYLGHRGPGVGTREADALEMAAATLSAGGTRSTRLYRTLVRERELCQDAEFFTLSYADSGMVGGWATPRAGVPVETVETALLEQMATLVDDPPEGAELDRVRALVERQIIEGAFQTCAGRADALSEHASVFGDPGRVNTRLAELLSIDGTDIASAASTYLTPDNRVTLVYEPEAAR